MRIHIALAVLALTSSSAAAAPSLDGSWTNLSLTGLDRAPGLKTLIVTAKQAAEYEHIFNDPDAADAFFAKLRQKSGNPAPPNVGGGRSEWFEHVTFDRIRGQFRSSAITYPKDGQLPYTKAAAERLKAAKKREARGFDNPEDRPVEERCIIGPGEPNGPPMANPMMNADYVIVQAPDAIAIEAQMNHDVRVIRLNSRHRPGARQWMGDSIGRWVGQTLVVDTVGFSPTQTYEHASGGDYVLSDVARVTEWFRRTSPTQISYRFRVVDPKTYKQPWGGEMILRATDHRMLEYACHEGNYSHRGILAGARKWEADGKTPEPLDGGDAPKKPGSGSKAAPAKP